MSAKGWLGVRSVAAAGTFVTVPGGACASEGRQPFQNSAARIAAPHDQGVGREGNGAFRQSLNRVNDCRGSLTQGLNLLLVGLSPGQSYSLDLSALSGTSPFDVGGFTIGSALRASALS